MKVCIFQPPYSTDMALSDELFEYKLRLLDECDESLDLIVLPEYSDVPCAVSSREQMLYYHNKYFSVLMNKCRDTAKRCGALLFVNALCKYGGEYRNTTFAVDKNGDIIGKYFKTHIPPSEKAMGIGYKYTMEPSEPYVLEIDGVRYGFLTCYDFYFYEAFSAIAQKNVDIIIGCSLQRSDSHYTTETICRFLSYNTNSYVLRSSVSFDENSGICGASMVVSPEGRVLANLGGRFGKAEVEIDPKAKFYKPAGYGREAASHYKYIEEGRNPWQYRHAGAGICPDDEKSPYPRVCLYGGFNTLAPGNSLAAFGAAAASGADELGFDVRVTEEGVLVASDCENPKLYAGCKPEEVGSSLNVVRLEDILNKFACRIVMNIHMKIWDENESDPRYGDIISLIKKYDCEKYVYFTTINEKAAEQFKQLASEFILCIKHDENRPEETVDRAIRAGAHKVEIPACKASAENIEKAHSHNIKCNVFIASNENSAEKPLNYRADTLVINDYLRIPEAVCILKSKFNG